MGPGQSQNRYLRGRRCRAFLCLVASYHVYVIELSDETCPIENRVRPDKPCVYVGQTARSPEERFQQHLAGYKAARKVRKYGVRLRPRLAMNYGHYPSK